MLKPNHQHYALAARYLFKHRDAALDEAKDECVEVRTIIEVQLKRQRSGIMPRVKMKEET